MEARANNLDGIGRGLGFQAGADSIEEFRTGESNNDVLVCAMQSIKQDRRLLCSEVV
jgi:hypothetical protein